MSSRLRTGHILFIDAVEFSLYDIPQQHHALELLHDALQQAEGYSESLANGDAMALDRGDAVATIFWENPLASVETARAVSGHARNCGLRVRLGLSNGPILMEDQTSLPKISGAIVWAQRVAALGDEGHILCTRSVREFLQEFDEYRKCVLPLGIARVKHGQEIEVFNLTCGDVGNASLPSFFLKNKEQASLAAEPILVSDRTGTTGGGVPAGSEFYIRRPVDALLETALFRHDPTILVQGARQTGKTSVLARGVHHANGLGHRTVVTDFQSFYRADMSSAESFYECLAGQILDQLDLPLDLLRSRPIPAGPGVRLDSLIGKQILNLIKEPIFWAMDEVDRLFTLPFADDVFAMMRSWHNKRAYDSSGNWSRLSIGLAYATDAMLFIKDPNQSPFNVGTRLWVGDFTLEETEDLNSRYGSRLSQEVLERLYSLLAGQPYLTRFVLERASAGDLALEAVFQDPAEVFRSHLDRTRSMLDARGLFNDVQSIKDGRPVPRKTFTLLESLGISTGTPEEPRPRCALYASI